METKHPVEGQFGSEFPTICNHLGVTAAWSRKTWRFREQFLLFLGKRHLMVKSSKILFRNFTWRHRLTLCWNFVKFIRWEIEKSAKSCVIYLTKYMQNFACFSNCRYCADCAQNLPGLASVNVLKYAPDFIQIGLLSAEL